MYRTRTPLIFYLLALLIGGVAIGGIYLYKEREGSDQEVQQSRMLMIYRDEKTNVSVPEGVHLFFDALSPEMNRSTSVAGEYFEFDRFAHELDRLGMLTRAGVGPGHETAFREFSLSLRKVGLKMPPIQGAAIEYHGFEWVKDDLEAVVVARHRLSAPVHGVTHLWVRWWLVRTPQSATSWKIYDFEEVASGCRLSGFWSILATAFKDRDRAEAIQNQVKKLLQIESAIVFREFDDLDSKLAEFQLDRSPVELRTALVQLKSLALLEKSKVREALIILDAIPSNDRESPIINLIMAKANLRLENYPEALAHADRFLVQVPHHDRGEYCRAFSLEHMGRTKEAIAAYERVLAMSPDDASAQEGWVRCWDLENPLKKK